MDSGATAHLTSGSGKNLQLNFNPSIRKSVIVGNGSCIPIAATRSLTLAYKPRPLSLQNILVTPAIIKNLVSVRRFTKDNTCSIEFDPFGFSIKDLQSKETLLRLERAISTQFSLLPIKAKKQIQHLSLNHRSCGTKD